jgi:hypothetical protein
MSTGPGPTRKADGSADASVDDIADLLVEGESQPEQVEGENPAEDGLDVTLETPAPVATNTFLPPPPAPAGGASDEEATEEGPDSTNMAYEDLLAKLVLPAKAPEAEAQMPALPSSMPEVEPIALPTPAAEPVEPFARASATSSSSFQVSSPTEERTLVTENPLVAEEQEAAAREGRSGVREQPVPVVIDGAQVMQSGPIAPLSALTAKSKLVYLMLGGLLVLVGMVLAVFVLKLLMPSPAPQPPVVITPVPQPPPAPPAHVEPLPPSPPAAPSAAAPAPAAVPVQPEQPSAKAEDTPENPPAEPEAAAAPTAEPEKTPRPRKTVHTKPAHAVARPVAATPKAAASPKATAAPAAKPGKPAASSKKSKSGWVDPFDN